MPRVRPRGVKHLPVRMTCGLNTRGSARTYVGKRELVQQTRREHARIRPGAPPALTVPALRHRPNLHRGPVPAHLDDAREHALSVDQGEQLAALEDEDPGSVLTILSNASLSSEASSRALFELVPREGSHMAPFRSERPGRERGLGGGGEPCKGPESCRRPSAARRLRTAGLPVAPRDGSEEREPVQGGPRFDQ